MGCECLMISFYELFLGGKFLISNEKTVLADGFRFIILIMGFLKEYLYPLILLIH